MDNAWNFRASDAHHAQIFLKNYYGIASHIESPEEGLRIMFKGVYDDRLCYSKMMVSTPFRCTWHNRSALTVISGFAGQAKFSADGATTNISPDVSTCVSSGVPAEITASPSLSIGITRFDEAQVRSVFSAWLGTSVDSTPRFTSTTFSPALAAQWTKIVDLITLLYARGESSDLSVQALKDYAISLLISGHPHDLSRFMACESAVGARVAAETHAFIDSSVLPDLTPSAIAEALGHPLPALARGFREHRGVTLRQAIYLARRARASRYPSMSRDGDAPGKATKEVERLRLHILGSLSDPLRTDELAAIAGVGENRLRNIFRQSFGVTPSQYILNERINWAHHLLVHTSKSIAEIAIEMGFSSQAHLNFAFRKKLGITPGTLRKSALQT